jgi:hypothetical protein
MATDDPENPQEGQQEPSESMVDRLVREYTTPEAIRRFEEQNKRLDAVLDAGAFGGIRKLMESDSWRAVKAINAFNDTPTMRALASFRAIEESPIFSLARDLERIQAGFKALAESMIPSEFRNGGLIASMQDIVKAQSRMAGFEGIAAEVARMSALAAVPKIELPSFTRLAAESVLSQSTRDIARLSTYLRELSQESTDLLAERTERLIQEAPEPRKGEPSNRKIVLATTRDLTHVIEAVAREPKERFKINPRVFEELVAELFDKLGYAVTLTPPTRDGGRDVIAEREDFEGRRILQIECKRYAPDNKVGIDVAQRLVGVVVGYASTSGVIVTTSDYSTDAREYEARVPHLIKLRNGEQFMELLHRVRAA